nr:MAG TPA: Internal virion protein D [Caudoviricetes sp.]
MANMPKEEALYHFKNAVFGKESNRNYGAYNGDSGAGGAYQFMPETWNGLCRQMGFDDWIGVHPSQVPPDVQDAVFDAYVAPIYDSYAEEGLDDYNIFLHMADSHYYGIERAWNWYQRHGNALSTNQEIADNGVAYESRMSYASTLASKALGDDSYIDYLGQGVGRSTGDKSPHFIESIGLNATPEGVDYMGDPYEYMDSIDYARTEAMYNTPAAPIPLSYLEGIKHGFEESTFGQWIMRPSGERGVPGGSYFPSDDELLAINNMFPNMDRAAKNEKIARLLGEATSKEHLMQLIEYEKERDERAYRAEEQDYLSIGALGSLTGSVFNPVNFIPYFGWAGRLGRAGKIVSSGLMQKAVRASWIGAQTGAINVADNYGAHKIGGVQYNPTLAFAGGMLAGTVLTGLGDLATSFIHAGMKHAARDLDPTLIRLDNIETRQAYMLAGYPDPRVVNFEEGARLLNKKLSVSTQEALQDIGKTSSYVDEPTARALTHTVEGGNGWAQSVDLRYAASSKGKAAKTKVGTKEYIESETERLLHKPGGVYIAPKKQIEHIAQHIGIELPKNARAFYSKDMDTVLIDRDMVKSRDDLHSLIAHEMIVHKGLDGLPANIKEPLLKAVGKKMSQGKGVWYDAMKHAQSNDPEEVLAHMIERQMGQGKDIPLLPELTRAMRHILPNGAKLSQKEINLTLKELAENTLKEVRGYDLLPDGTAVSHNGNIRFSVDNPTHPHAYGEAVRLVSEMNEGFYGGIGGAIAPWIRAFAGNKYTGSNFGKTAFSPSKTLAKVIPNVFRDIYQGRMSATYKKGVDTAEGIRERIVGELQKNDVAFIDARREYIENSMPAEEKRTLGHDDRILTANERAVVFHDIIHGALTPLEKEVRLKNLDFEVSPELQEMSDTIQAARNAVVDTLMHSNKDALIEGRDLKAILDETFDPLDKGFTRSTDPIKRSIMLNHPSFGGDEKQFEDFLYRYCKAAMRLKDAANKERFLSDIQKPTHFLYEKAKGLEGDAFPSDLYEEWIDREARQWAKGQVDHDMSRLVDSPLFTEESKDGSVSMLTSLNGGVVVKPLDFLERRTIMDSSMKMKLPNGEDFSFDKDLRDYDVDSLLAYQTSTTAGEVAFRHAYGTDENFIKLTAQIHSDLMKAQEGIKDKDGNLHTLSASKAQDIMNAWYNMNSSLRGRAITKSVVDGRAPSIFSDIGMMLQKLTYSTVGGMLGVNQMSELIGAINESGWRILPRYISYVIGNDKDEVGAHVFAQAIGYHEAINFQRGRLWTSREFARRYRDTSIDRAFARVDTGLNALGRLTGMLNGMPYLTRTMTDYIRGGAMIDLQRLAKGKNTEVFHKLIDEHYLAEAGIDAAKLKRVYAAINKYMPEGTTAAEARKNYRVWRDADRETYNAVERLLEDTAARSITRASIGTTNSWFKSSPMRRLMGFFLNFTFMATHTQFLRMMNRSGYDMATAVFFNALAGLSGYGTYSLIQSAVKYPLDADARQEYLDRRLSSKSLILAALTRGAFLSPLAYGTNIASMMGIEAADLRTTTGNRAIRNEGWASNAAGQFPVLNTLNSVKEGLKSLEGQAEYTLTDGKYGRTLSTGDVRRAQGVIPFGNWMGTQLLMSLLSHTLALPDKPKKGTEVIKEEKEQRKQNKRTTKTNSNSK